ncbi:hypothetical protein NPIL_580041 [Nephila pilipes]|uniref:Uncharacterized protein n=1 Tax=Nephila pilipes TaxID=299642 RepID=A0A8X6PM22_NEPPI|nr:hypothetical protein NPIL_580041 [Nephila pilipes]
MPGTTEKQIVCDCQFLLVTCAEFCFTLGHSTCLVDIPVWRRCGARSGVPVCSNRQNNLIESFIGSLDVRQLRFVTVLQVGQLFMFMDHNGFV